MSTGDEQASGITGVEPVKSVDESVPMRPGRNGGSLRNGSQPGNKGGSGATPSVLRRKARESYEKWIRRTSVLSDKYGEALEDAFSDDPDRVEKGEAVIKRFKSLGIDYKDVDKTESKKVDVGVPKQAELVMSNPELLDTVGQAAYNLYGKGAAELVVGETIRLVDEGSGATESVA